MRWLDQLAAELSVRGVNGRERSRILLELCDHIACEPGCEDRLGDPRELAGDFADQLATDTARRAAYQVFVALTTAAVALVASQLAIQRAGGYPGLANGVSMALFAPAVLGMFIGSQIALVAGTLAALRAVRRRRARCLPAAELALIRRRARVALGGGFATVAGVALYAVNFASVMPASWLVLTGSLAAVSAAALFAALRGVARAGTVISGAAGDAGDVYDDLPVLRRRWLRRRPWRLGAIASLAVAVLMAAFEGHAEHSLAEGLQRGLFEGLTAAVGFALLGRAIGVAPPTPAELRPTHFPWAGTPTGAGRGADGGDGDLPAEGDRTRAELVLRESFAHGRLTVDELSARLEAVHRARSLGELRAALDGLLGRL